MFPNSCFTSFPNSRLGTPILENLFRSPLTPGPSRLNEPGRAEIVPRTAMQPLGGIIPVPPFDRLHLAPEQTGEKLALSGILIAVGKNQETLETEGQIDE